MVRSDVARIDGRVLRGRRNRTALLDALLEILREGNTRPKAQDVASRAGVSVRSLFQHFADLEALHVETAIRERERVVAMLDQLDTTIAAARSVEEKVRATVEMRAALWEATIPPCVVFTLRSIGQERERLEGEAVDVVTTIRAQLRRAFDHELRMLDGDPDHTVIGLQVSLSQEAWMNMRVNQKLSIEDSKDLMFRIASAYLVPRTTTSG